MMKKLTCVALAAVCAAALAQTTPMTPTQQPGQTQPGVYERHMQDRHMQDRHMQDGYMHTGARHGQMLRRDWYRDVSMLRDHDRRDIIHWMGLGLGAGDAYYFDSMLRRMPPAAEIALRDGLVNVQAQANLLRDRQQVMRTGDRIAAIIITRRPHAPDTMTVVTQPQGQATAPATAMDTRPMRMLVDRGRPLNLSDGEARDLIVSDLSTGQGVAFGHWWMNRATPRERTIVNRLVTNAVDYVGVLPADYRPMVR
jgi:hypothetical protein